MRFPMWIKGLLTGLLTIIGILAMLVFGVWWWQNRAYTQAQEMQDALKVGQPITTVLPLLQAQHHDGWHLAGADGEFLHADRSRPTTDKLEKALQENPSGNLSVMLVGFVFLRFFVNVDFENGAITKVWLSQLD